MTNTIQEYSKIEAGITALADQYSIVPDCTNDNGLKLCKKSYREIRKVETALETKRKELGAQARDHLKAIGDEAKVIDGRLKEISGPFKLAFECREQEIKDAEAKRIADIKERIEQLNEFVMDAQSEDSTGITAITEAIDMIDCSVGFDEFTAEALQAKQSVLSQLGTLLQNKLTAEGAERERQAAEKLQRDLAAQQQIEIRINNLRMIPVGFMGKSAGEISAKHDSLVNYTVPTEEFGDRHDEAVTAKDKVVQQLSMMLQQQQMVEEAQAKQEEAQDRADREAEQQRQQEEPTHSTFVNEQSTAVIMESDEIIVDGVTTKSVEPDFTVPTDRKPAPRQDTLYSSIVMWADQNRISKLAIKELNAIIDRYI